MKRVLNEEGPRISTVLPHWISLRMSSMEFSASNAVRVDQLCNQVDNIKCYQVANLNGNEKDNQKGNEEIEESISMTFMCYLLKFEVNPLIVGEELQLIL